MKNFKFNLGKVLVICFVSFLAVSCAEDTNNEIEEVGSSKTIDLSGVIYSGVKFPQGTIGEYSDDRKTLLMKLPKDYLYVARKSDGFLGFASIGTYTCNSSCSGCEPYRAGEVVGCSSCPRGSKDKCVGGWGKSYQFEIGDGQDGKIINLNEMANQIDASEIPENALYTFDELLENESISKKFDALLTYLNLDINQENITTKNMLFDFYGVTIILAVPQNRFNQVSKILASFEDVNAACSCNNGSSGCTLEDIKKFGKKVGVKCAKGGCYPCSMSGI
jgi:hypothetical protein